MSRTLHISLCMIAMSWDLVHSQKVRGVATMYGGNPSGNACGYKDVPTKSFPFGYYAACGGATFNTNGIGCGACFKVTCLGPDDSTNIGCKCDPKTPSVVISCMDRCPECSSNHLDLTDNSMELITGEGLAGTCGRIKVDIERVNCDYTSNIKIRSKSGTSAHWYGLHVDDVAGAGAVHEVQLRPRGVSTFNSYKCSKKNPTFWLCDLGAGRLQAPMDVRLTNELGETVECRQCITNLRGNAEFDFGTNFKSVSSLPNAQSPVRPSSTPPRPASTPPRPASTPPRPANSPAQASSSAPNQVCIDQDKLNWQSFDHSLKLNGNTFRLKGVNWFGFETTLFNLHGLDRHNIDWYLSWLAERGFNAIRLPFSQDFVERGSASLQLYRNFVRKAGSKGFLVMPDLHSKTAGAWRDGLETVKGPGNTYGNVLKAWAAVANLLKDEWNVFAADCYNEPHDVTNAQWPEWIAFCEQVATTIWKQGARWVIVIEGTNHDCRSLGSSINCAWGENLMGVPKRTFSLTTAGPHKLVWSPHVYGEAVTGNSAYSKQAWTDHWGYLTQSGSSNQAAIMIGEFGTPYANSKQRNWLNTLVDYLIEIDQRNTFYWSLNPNSGDTGGLLKADWTTPEQGKLDVLARLQPNPSLFTYRAASRQVCVSGISGSGRGVVNNPPANNPPANNPPANNPPPNNRPPATPINRPNTQEGPRIVLRNTRNTQPYYLNFVIGGLEECMNNVRYVELRRFGSWRRASKLYRRRDGLELGWLYQAPVSFDRLLPMTVRIAFNNGKFITLSKLLTNLGATSEFTSDRTCNTFDGANQNRGSQRKVNLDDLPLRISTCDGANRWYYTAKIENLPQDTKVQSFEMKDSSGKNKWIAASSYDDENGCYVFNTGDKPYTAPFSFRINARDQTLEQEKVVTALAGEGSAGDFAQNFQIVPASQTDVESTNGSPGKQGEKGVIILVLVVMSVAAVVLLVGAIIYCLRHKQKKVVSFDHGRAQKVAQDTAEAEAEAEAVTGDAEMTVTMVMADEQVSEDEQLKTVQ